MSLLRALTPVVEAFEHLEIRYQIGGSVASSAHGLPRSTLDVDLVADLRDQHVDPLCAALRADYYAESQLVRDAVQHGSCTNFLHLASGYKVDVFVLRRTAYDLCAFARSVQRRLTDPAGRLFCFATAEDILLRKLLWYRAGDEASERQWNDVLGILSVQEDSLDHGYLYDWARQLGVDDLLARAERKLPR